MSWWLDFFAVPIRETSWLTFGMSTFVKGSMVLALALLAAKALPKAPAAVRHWVLALSLLTLLALPLVSMVLPAWQIPVSTTLMTPPSPEPREPSQTTAPPATERAPSPRAQGGWEQAPVSASSGRAAISWSWKRVGAWVWLGGIVLFFSRLMYGLTAARREVSRSAPVTDDSWNSLLDELAKRIGVRKRVRLLRTQRSMVPITTGIFRPRILLPADSGQWVDDRRRSVLLHELAHVRRRDCLTQIVTQVACAAYWWNPLAWYAASRLRQESERACDDMVLAAGTRASDYAHDLLEMARALHTTRSSPLSSVALAHRSRFEDRLLAILDPKLARQALSRFGAVLAAVVTIALVLPLAALQPAVQAREPAPPPHVVNSREPAGVPVLVGQVQVTEDPSPAPSPEPAQEETESIEREEEKDEEEEEERAVVNERAAAALMEALSDPEPSVRAQAVGVLGQLEYRPAVEPLMGALDDEDAEIRENAAWGLGQIGDERAVEPLSAALKDPDPAVREQAAWALGQIEAEQSWEALAQALQDDDPDVREQAAWALGMVRASAAVDPLIAALRDPDTDVREQAAWALGMIQDERASDALGVAIRDEEADVREQVAWALGMIQSATGVDAAIEALKDPDPDVREEAAWALGMIQDEKAIDPLSEALRDEDPDVREQAAWALGMVAKERREEDESQP